MARLAFFGTPDFAVPSLEAVLATRELGHEVVLVVCQPDRPKGRGKSVLPPPVKVCAAAAGIPVAQPATLKKGTPAGDEFFDRFSDLRVDLAVVTAYGRILPRRLLALPPRGFVNVHASLLPRWRGAAPIQRAIEAGDAQTGVCLMDMIFELDAGDVYVERRMPIAPEDDAATLTPKLAALGKATLLEHLPALIEGKLPKTPQPSDGVTYAHMLRKEEGNLDFAQPAVDLCRQVRAMHPWPGSYTTLEGEVLKLFVARPVEDPRAITAPPGTILSVGEELVVATRDGAIAFGEGQLPNKRRMPIAELLRGRPMATGVSLGT